MGDRHDRPAAALRQDGSADGIRMAATGCDARAFRKNDHPASALQESQTFTDKRDDCSTTGGAVDWNTAQPLQAGTEDRDAHQLLLQDPTLPSRQQGA